jgi:hypothetical protein
LKGEILLCGGGLFGALIVTHFICNVHCDGLKFHSVGVKRTNLSPGWDVKLPVEHSARLN